MAVAYALSRQGTVSRVVNLSGFVPLHPQVTVSPATVEGTRFFWGHGTSDPAIPFALAERGRAALRAAGADITTFDYEMDHGISPAELRDLSDWLTDDHQSRG